MNVTDAKLASVLLKYQLIDQAQLGTIQARQIQVGGKFHHLAVEFGFTGEAQVRDALARELGISSISLDSFKPEPDALRQLNLPFCEKHHVIPCALRDEGRTLWLATSDPFDLAVLDQVRAMTRIPQVSICVGGHREILSAVRNHYRYVETDPRQGAERGIELRGTSEAEEFKITNVSGQTILGGIQAADIRRPGAAAAAAVAPGMPAATPGMPIAGSAAGGDNLLHEVNTNVKRALWMIDAMLDMLVQKGVVTADELKQRGMR